MESFWIHRDVTQQKKLELQIKQDEQNFKNFFNTSIDFLWVLDELGKIIEVNDTILRQLGYTEQELTGLPIFSLLPKTGGKKPTG